MTTKSGKPRMTRRVKRLIDRIYALSEEEQLALWEEFGFWEEGD